MIKGKKCTIVGMGNVCIRDSSTSNLIITIIKRYTSTPIRNRCDDKAVHLYKCIITEGLDTRKKFGTLFIVLPIDVINVELFGLADLDSNKLFQFTQDLYGISIKNNQFVNRKNIANFTLVFA